MKKLLSKIFPSKEGVRPFVQEIKPESDPQSAKVHSTVVPNDLTFTQWKDGGWNEVLNPDK